MARKTQTSLTFIGAYQVNLGNQIIPYTVKRSSGARYARLEIKLDTGLNVVIPKFYKIEQIQALLETKKRWILNKLARFSQSPALKTERELNDSDTIPYLGRDLEIKINRHHGDFNSVGIESGTEIKVEGNKLIANITNTTYKLNSVIVQWYKKQAAEIIGAKVEKLSTKFRLTYNKLYIRSQRTRWGSCSYNGNLNFNWKLIMAPEPVIDYVVIHELMHLEEMNHAKKFWKLVAEQCPQWREHKKWLREHEAELAMKLII